MRKAASRSDRTGRERLREPLDLLGPDGCTRVFGPQKGIQPDELEWHEARLARLAAQLPYGDLRLERLLVLNGVDTPAELARLSQIKIVEP